MQINQSKAHIPQPPPLLGSHKSLILWANIPQSPRIHVPNHSGQPLYTEACWKYSNYPLLTLLNLPTLPHTLLPTETTIKSLPHTFSSSPLPPDRPWCLPMEGTLYGMAFPLLLGMVSNKLCFQWQSSYDILASPCPNNNKTYILKQLQNQK